MLHPSEPSWSGPEWLPALEVMKAWERVQAPALARVQVPALARVQVPVLARAQVPVQALALASSSRSVVPVRVQVLAPVTDWVLVLDMVRRCHHRVAQKPSLKELQIRRVGMLSWARKI